MTEDVTPEAIDQAIAAGTPGTREEVAAALAAVHQLGRDVRRKMWADGKVVVGQDDLATVLGYLTGTDAINTVPAEAVDRLSAALKEVVIDGSTR